MQTLSIQHGRRVLRAFTLVELIAVLVVLAILSGVALPKYIDYRDRAQASAARGARSALAVAVANARLDDAATGGTHGEYPSDLSQILETQDSNNLLNPYHHHSLPIYDVEFGGEEKMHPINKTIEMAVSNSWGSIWYNADNGQVRFRVPYQGSVHSTMELYNLVNESTIETIGQTH